MIYLLLSLETGLAKLGSYENGDTPRSEARNIHRRVPSITSDWKTPRGYHAIKARAGDFTNDSHAPIPHSCVNLRCYFQELAGEFFPRFPAG